jgi:Lon protease-like protein
MSAKPANGYNCFMAQDDPFDDSPQQTWAAVPLFPLPNTVLFPRAVLPLHIFEERYKTMTSDALEGNRRIAMALLKPGWEKNYYQRPEIEPIVCLGEILTHELLPDGKYNFLLQGVARAKIIREHTGKPYRTADLQRLPEQTVLEMDLLDERQRLAHTLSGDLNGLPGARQFTQMLSSPMGTSVVADLIAFHLLEDTLLKQELLAEPDVRGRVVRIAGALESLKPVLSAGRVRFDEPNWN